MKSSSIQKTTEESIDDWRFKDKTVQIDFTYRDGNKIFQKRIQITKAFIKQVYGHVDEEQVLDAYREVKNQVKR